MAAPIPYPAIGASASAYLSRAKYSDDRIRSALLELVGREVKGHVVDAGSGDGGWLKRLRLLPEITNLTSVDLVDGGASHIEDVEFHLADLSVSPLPCEDGALDWVFALEVIEHLANPRYFIAAAARCLKPGGRLALTTPCNDSITAKLSFLFRGYFPAFCEHDYKVSGHITPITELDMRRMANEFNYSSINFFYPLPGRIPRLTLTWQKLFPFLRGKFWSDSMIAVLTK